MPLSPAQLQTLKTELNSDPNGYGYAADVASGYVGGLVEKLNLPRGSIRLKNGTVDTGALRTATTKAVYDGLTTAERTWYNWLTGAGTLVVTNDLLQTLAGIPTASGSVWASGVRTEMNANMEAVLRYTGSRAQELFGVQVTLDDVVNALRS